MPQPTIWGRLIALAAIVMCAVFALSASGDNKANSAFAIVDLQKLSSKYTAKEVLETEFRSMQQKYGLRLQRRDGMPFLTEEDQVSLDTLYEKPNRTDADNNKIKEIEKKNADKVAEVQALRQKADPSQAEKDKLAAADKAFREAQSNFAQLKDQLDGKVQQFNKDKSEELNNKIRTTVAKVAEKNNVAIVFTSDVALYAGTDITDQVVGELNKK
jgi:Skp family chaperone for outer membrane proteins